MRILAFDTATPATAVALLAGERHWEARDDPEPGARPGHARRLLPLIAEVLQQSGTGWDAIDRIAVGVGPGTFTGLRIGIATAHGLARARAVELVGVSTLTALALSAWDAGHRAGILGLLDARRGEAFGATWAPQAVPGAGDAATAPRVIAPADLPALAASTALAVGDGAIKFREILGPAGVEVPPDDSPLHRVSALYHARLAVDLPAGPPEAVLPAYLRLPDAELNRKG